MTNTAAKGMGAAVDAMNPIAAAAGGVGALIGTLDNVISGGYRQRQAARQQNQYAQDQMILGNQLQSDILNKEQMFTREMYEKSLKDQSPEAVAERYRQAGMNPALAMGGGGGAGGAGKGEMASGGAPGSVGVPGTSLPNTAAVTQATLQGAMQLANLELIKAQAKKTDKEADKIAGVDTDVVKKSIELMGTEIKLKEAETDGRRIENRYNEVGARIKEMTEDTEIKMVEKEFERLTTAVDVLKEDLEDAERRNEIGEAQKESLMKEADARLDNIMMDTALKSAQIAATSKGIELTDAQINSLQSEVRERWANIGLKRAEYHLDRRNTRLNEAKHEFERWKYGRELSGGIISQIYQFANHWIDQMEAARIENSRLNQK